MLAANSIAGQELSSIGTLFLVSSHKRAGGRDADVLREMRAFLGRLH
ncbi:MAG TPA: hypothetical protein VKA59_02285 [Vicinamibacterales bacterium]|nr:hypothetical protein [Vicinamibacterales bacterium]